MNDKTVWPEPAFDESVKISAQEYARQTRSIFNTSGMQPVEYKILIEPEEVEEVSKGGIVLAVKTTEREAMAQVKGKLIAIGGNAFEDWTGQVPQVGDSIYFAKYAGYVIKGADGKEYRLANDKDVSAIIQQ